MAPASRRHPACVAAIFAAGAAILSACSIIKHTSYYAPTAPGGKVISGGSGPKDTVKFTEDDFELIAYADHLSEGTTSFGPPLLPVIPGAVLGKEARTDWSEGSLGAYISVRVKKGVVKTDLGQVILASPVLKDPLRPVAIRKTSHPSGALDDVVSETAIELHEAKHADLYYLSYGVKMSDLDEFELRLGGLEANGRTIQLPPVQFRRRGGHAHVVAP